MMQPTLRHDDQHFMDKDFPVRLELKNKLNLNLYEHAHDYFQICYLTRGACIHYVQDQEILLVKGDMFTIPPFISHRLKPYPQEQVEIALINFMPGVLEQNDFALDACYFPKINISEPSQLVLEQLISGMTSEHERKQEGYRLLIKADLIRMLVTAIRETARMDQERPGIRESHRKLFYEAAAYIDLHYTENLQLEELARMAALSPTYFSSLFKAIKGQPFVQYVNAARIRHTMELLRATDWSITEICFAAGFNNASHFNRVFRKETGLSPLQYRKGIT